MAKTERKNLDQLLEEVEIEIVPEHVNDWHYCTSAEPFKNLLKRYPELTSRFNIVAATSAPKSIKYRQRDCDFIDGKRGDYLFVDRNGGRMSVPFTIFKLLWK